MQKFRVGHGQEGFHFSKPPMNFRQRIAQNILLLKRILRGRKFRYFFRDSLTGQGADVEICRSNSGNPSGEIPEIPEIREEVGSEAWRCWRSMVWR